MSKFLVCILCFVHPIADICGPKTCQLPEELCTVVNKTAECHTSCDHMYGGCHPSQNCVEIGLNVRCSGRNENGWKGEINLKTWVPSMKFYGDNIKPQITYHCAPNDNYFISDEKAISCSKSKRIKIYKAFIGRQDRNICSRGSTVNPWASGIYSRGCEKSL